MPPRRAGRSSSTGAHQAVLSFKSPPKVVKNTNLLSNSKKDLKKKLATTTPPPISDGIIPTPARKPITKVSDEDLEEYYKTNVLSTRRIQPLNQEDMSLLDKVLRHWDMSVQYGPCVGVSRLERWWRAEKLGLGPPELIRIVCEKEEGGGVSWLEEALSLRGLCKM